MNKIIVMLAFAAALVTASPAHAEFVWRHFGVAPYASTRVEAMRMRESAFRAMGDPQPVVALLMEATKKPGERILLTNGDHLLAMLSKGGIVHRDVIVGFVTPPVSGKMEYAAPAERWQVSWQGKIYTVILPEICNNWSSIAPAPEECSTVTYSVEPGDQVRFAVLARKRLPASACWQLQDGTETSALPSPCDTCDWIGPKSVIPTGFEPLHSGRYTAHAVHQSLRFPREVERAYVALCITRQGQGQSNSWIVQPAAWEGGTVTMVRIPYGNQQWPVWGPDTIDWSKWPADHHN